MLSEQTHTKVARFYATIGDDLRDTFRKCFYEHTEFEGDLDDYFESVEPLLWLRQAFDWGLHYTHQTIRVSVARWTILNDKWETDVIERKWYYNNSLKVFLGKLTAKEINRRIVHATSCEQYYDMKVLGDEKNGIPLLAAIIMELKGADVDGNILKELHKYDKTIGAGAPYVDESFKLTNKDKSKKDACAIKGSIVKQYNDWIESLKKEVKAIFARKGLEESSSQCNDMMHRINVYRDVIKANITRIMPCMEDKSRLSLIKCVNDTTETLIEYVNSIISTIYVEDNDEEFKQKAEEYMSYEESVRQLQGKYNKRTEPVEKPDASPTAESAASPTAESAAERTTQRSPEPTTDSAQETERTSKFPKWSDLQLKDDVIVVTYDYRDDNNSLAVIKLSDALSRLLHQKKYTYVVHGPSSDGLKTRLRFGELGRYNVDLRKLTNGVCRGRISSVDISKFIFDRFDIKKGCTANSTTTTKVVKDGVIVTIEERF